MIVGRRTDRLVTIAGWCGIILAISLGLVSLASAHNANQSQDNTSAILSRRAVNIEALNAFQVQLTCENETLAAFAAALTDPNSPERAVTLNTQRDQLRTMKARCVDPNPIQSPDPDTTSTTVPR